MIHSLELSEVQIEKVIKLVHLHTGITIAPTKKNMIEGRIRRRLKELSLQCYESYLNLLENDLNEKQEFINIITTNETSFFRTKKVWDYFKDEFLKNWRVQEKVKIWSAAASTGEESYSIAMLCEEEIRTGRNIKYEIIGTDISTRALKVAQEALYTGRNFKNLRLKFDYFATKYFDLSDEEGVVKSFIQKNIHYLPYNLFTTPKPPISEFDIVFLRNVLIYFEKKDQMKVIANAAKAMKKGCVLILGESESINGLSDAFDFVAPQIYVKK